MAVLRLTKILLAMGIVSIAASSQARTWYVEKDGTGDFTVIQVAVDAASPGDVIEIGPGWYSDYRTIQSPYGDWEQYVRVQVEDLTLRGKGIGVTIIGPTEPGHRCTGVSFLVPGSSFTLEGCEIVYCDHPQSKAVDGRSHDLVIANCRIVDSEDGLRCFEIDGTCEVRDCVFDRIDHWGLELRAENAVTSLHGCKFTDTRVGMYLGNGHDILVEDCRFVGGQNGVGFYGVADGTIRGCRFDNQSQWSIALSDDSVATIEDNEIHTNGAGLWLLGAAVSATGNIIESATRCIWTKPLEVTGFHGNHIVCPDGALLVHVYGVPHRDPHLDFTMNWWGTMDAQEIAEKILDGHDLGDIGPFIDFEPFLGGPVRTESTSWGAVKTLFR